MTQTMTALAGIRSTVSPNSRKTDGCYDQRVTFWPQPNREREKGEQDANKDLRDENMRVWAGLARRGLEHPSFRGLSRGVAIFHTNQDLAQSGKGWV